MDNYQKKIHRKLLACIIRAYRSHPCLWRSKSKDYCDKANKAAAYENLLIKYKPIEWNADKDAVVKTINILGSKYRREKKRVY